MFDKAEMQSLIFRLRSQEQELQNKVEELHKEHKRKLKLYVDLKADRLALEKAYFVVTGETP